MSTPTDAVADRAAWLAHLVHDVLGRHGAVVQTSGGLDSTVTLALCARALGTDRVTALFLPDEATGPETRGFARLAAESAGVPFVERSIAAAWAGMSEPGELDRLVRGYFPDYDPQRDAYSLVLAHDRTRRLGVLAYDLAVGERHAAATARRPIRAADLRRLLAHQNRKQRLRMTFAYSLAEAEHLAVVGASNADELDTGFVVKYGDDAADVCAIGDLAKDEVRALGRALGIPESILARTPTTDTFGLDQTQDDYYYALPAPTLRRLLATPADEVERLADEAPGWSPSALRGLRAAIGATRRHLATRSVRRPADDPAPDAPGGSR